MKPINRWFYWGNSLGESTIVWHIPLNRKMLLFSTLPFTSQFQDHLLILVIFFVALCQICNHWDSFFGLCAHTQDFYCSYERTILFHHQQHSSNADEHPFKYLYFGIISCQNAIEPFLFVLNFFISFLSVFRHLNTRYVFDCDKICMNLMKEEMMKFKSHRLIYGCLPVFR